ncbi:AAA family ATPase [Schwartzia succinivorans]|jgi:energy-coupling factor transporter ATP-binding protein EcfA2|uniref:AAA domain (Dynein-related subfamily) n=1 Tax=Schwartzia succinivorans DSM 10502 TaxID=1123243 RepID=A0A1M4Z9S3_9FIRM|nr:AAA family ATPase [Schwartzia succinivorans]SHF14809.1 AAA domain (dynein-related subfamily) [Schwartzia succinivorans DSM 10502]
MAIDWSISKEKYHNSSSPEEWIKIFMDDVKLCNEEIWKADIDGEDRKWNIFRGKIELNDEETLPVIKEIKTIFSREVMNPYLDIPLKVSILKEFIAHNNFIDGQEVIFTVKARKMDNPTELLFCEKIKPLKGLQLRSYSPYGILQRIKNFDYFLPIKNFDSRSVSDDENDEIGEYICKCIAKKKWSKYLEKCPNLEMLEKEIEEKNTEIIKLKKRKNDFEDEARIIDENILKAKGQLVEVQLEIEKQQDKLAFLKAFDVQIDTLFQSISEDAEYHENGYKMNNFQEAISYLQSRLHNEYQLDYSVDILRDIYLGLETGKLLLLVGRPGTGKTSLVRYLAKSFGFADAAIIPVQSNWADKGDLIGYYNPMDKTYYATQFLDKLLEFCQAAQHHPDKLYFICLDEMNLAHVEHYFAEFLSILQERNPEKRMLRLYSSTLRSDIVRELKMNVFWDENDQRTVICDKDRFKESTVSERKYYLELCRQAMMFSRYPETLTIPGNIKFFGTLNQDETTLDLSPKVLDRAYVIRLENQPRIDDSDVDTGLPLIYQTLMNYESDISDDFSMSTEDILEKIKKVLDGGLSRRGTAFMESGSIREWEKALGRRAVWDCLVASLVLPKMRYDSRTDTNWNGRIGAIRMLCSNFPMSEKLLESILSEDEIDFWRA